MPPPEPPPLLDAHLRHAAAFLARRVDAALAEAGFADLRPAHIAVFEVIPVEGGRGSVMAEAAGMTKQSMGALVDHLERHGYVLRGADPDDRRARVVQLTDRGWKAVMCIRACRLEVEQQWERQLGARRYATFRASLERIAGAAG